MDIYQETINRLIKANIHSPRLEARVLIAHAINTDTNEINSSTIINDMAKSKLEIMIQERINHKPLDKIIGSKAFYRHNFLTSIDVLSPRPDTEILVEEAIRIIQENKSTNLLDLGTGSGCIVLSILSQCKNLSATAVDISTKALNIAKKNADHLTLSNRCKFVNASWFDVDFNNKIENTYDIIVSNPPYIPTSDIEKLEPEVKNFDPILALDGGANGLDCYKQIAKIAKEKITNNGYVLVEAGIKQEIDIINIFTSYQLQHIASINDLNSIPRCIVFKA